MKQLTEADVCSKLITPAIVRAGWDEMLQIRREVSFTKALIIVRGKLVTRSNPKRADIVLSYKPNIPFVRIEARNQSPSINLHGQ